MIIGIETSSLGIKHTGTSRYLACLLEQLGKSSNRIVKFNSDERFKRNVLSGKIKKVWYRNYLLREKINISNADCVIFPDYYMPAGIKKKSAIVIHDLSFISHPQFYSRKFAAYYNFQIKRTLKQNPVIVTVSEYSKNNIVNYLNVRAKDVLLVQGYSKPDLRIYNETIKLSDDRPYLLYVGHIEPRKNLNFMVEGFLKWKERAGSDLKLKIIGELWIGTPSTKALFRNYAAHPDIEFKGYVTEEELQASYGNAAGFIHTSFEEGFGFPVLEAMNYNLPLLCSENIATAEISGRHSIKINPSNLDSYCEGLERLNEIILRQRRISYEVNYSPGKTMQQIEALLDKLKNMDKKIYQINIPPAKSHIGALEKTLLYASLFNCGVSQSKLHPQVFDLKLTETELKKAINESSLKGNTIIKNDYLFLNWNDKSFYSKKEKQINKEKAERLLRFLNKLPFVSMIAFSGGTSHYGILNHDDIDLFIITKPDSVYIVYLIIHLCSFIMNARKDLCANYLIDESNLNISHSYEFFTAHQIITLIPFKNPGMLNRFLKENDWVKEFFPNFIAGNTEASRQLSKNYLLKPLNIALLLIYKLRYRKKIISLRNKGSLILKQNCLKLHTNDHREKIISEFQKRIQAYYDKQDDSGAIQNQELVEVS